ncbi:MAG: hypothetical protein ACK5M1_10565 [Xanthomarina gelatinilytica]|uniref:hypothetical protein n=1 Tax=Xanthomarina gelatinilytica TaxID=1137281 RepID=UPI003A88C7F5
MDKTTSEGKCIYCSKTYKKAGINRHLAKHLEDESATNPKGKSFHINIEANPRWGNAPYFLSVLMDGNAKMKVLDDFLRSIWLECCGHLSAFRIPQRRQGGTMFDFLEAERLLEEDKIEEYEVLMETSMGEIPMGRKAQEVFYEGMKLEYEYDFGSSTELLVSVLGEYSFKPKSRVLLLSRNEPLDIQCETCGKAIATEVCTVCSGYEDEGIFCTKCAKKHAKNCEDFEDYAAMPIVNSPRMGVCAYEGGIIDTERDRIR